MCQRIVERFGSLPGKCAPRRIGNRAGNHNRQFDIVFVKHLLNRKHRSLGIERVENGFDQDNVRAAAHQTTGRFHVGCDQRIEGNIAETGVVDIGGNATSTASRP